MPEQTLAAAAATPELHDLAQRVARLNPAAGEIGAGMLADLVERAQIALMANRPQVCMQMSAHTPGPWTWDGYSLRPTTPDPDNHAVHTIIDAEQIGWGFVASDRAATRAESAANLALIAAAPDLLDAARAAAAILDRQKWRAEGLDGHPQAAALRALRAAISKATEVTPQ